MSAADKRDVVVIGGGHNGLTAAALLAKAGRKVLLVERENEVGGTARADEFHPGFRSAGLHHDARAVSLEVVRELSLEQHGLKLREHAPDVHGLDTRMVLRGDATQNEGLRELRRFLDRIRPTLARTLLGPPIDVLDPAAQSRELLGRALGLRRLGGDTMLELLRLPPLPIADFLREWVQDEGLACLLAVPALSGGFAGPRSPGTTLNWLRLEAMAGPGPIGGGPALVAALERAAKSNGVEIRTSAPVQNIRVANGRVQAVVLESGEEIAASTIAAACSAKRTLLDLLQAGALPSRLVERMRAFRTRGTTAQVLLALSKPLPFERACTGARLDDIERAFDAVKYRQSSAEPILDLYQPATDGAAVLSVLVHFAPYDLDAGWTDGERERLGDRVIDRIEQRIPGTRANVIAGAVRAPVDLEQRYALPGGQIHHGEHALDQLLVRPAPECCRYATPVDGLFLCGSGSWPGGGLTCRPGQLGAATILARRA